MSGSTPAARQRPAVVVEDLGVRYRIYPRPMDRLRQMVARSGTTYYRELWAVQGVTFAVPSGSTFGIIGPNGSGKSTILKVIAGLLAPTAGRVARVGRLSALLELGAGFNGEYSGRENVFINAAMLGLSREEIEAIYPAVVKFSELAGFMEQPVKTYSSGMYVRLAFAVVAHIDPDVMVVDEALAVGDTVFQHRCMRKIKELQERGATILLVTHDMNAVSSFCDTALWIDGGRMRLIGTPETVVKQYLAWAYAKQDEELKITTAPAEGPTVMRYGNGRATVTRHRILDETGTATQVLKAGMIYSFEIEAEFHAASSQPILGFQIRDHYGKEIFSMNTVQSRIALEPAQAGDRRGARFRFRWPEFAEATYSFSPSVAEGTQESHLVLDWIEGASYVRSAPGRFVLGLIRISDVEAAAYEPERA